jgi:hypothetical protein
MMGFIKYGEGTGLSEWRPCHWILMKMEMEGRNLKEGGSRRRRRRQKEINRIRLSRSAERHTIELIPLYDIYNNEPIE